MLPMVMGCRDQSRECCTCTQMNLDPGEGCGQKRSGSTLPSDKVFPLEVYFQETLVLWFF